MAFSTKVGIDFLPKTEGPDSEIVNISARLSLLKEKNSHGFLILGKDLDETRMFLLFQFDQKAIEPGEIG